jgi:hypothetical protein
MGAYDQKLLAETIVRTKFVFDDGPYVLASLRLEDYSQAAKLLADVTDPFVEIIRDSSEVSVVVTAATWQHRFVPAFGDRPLLGPLAKIFCNVDETCTGYLLTILNRLSPQDVGVYVQGAYVTDHIFIHSEDTEKAKQLLGQLQADMRQSIAA